MIFSKKINLLAVIFLIGTSLQGAHVVDIMQPQLPVFKLKRVVFPQDSLTEQEKDKAFYREMRRYAVTTGVAVGAVAVMLIVYMVRQAALDHEAEVKAKKLQVYQDRQKITFALPACIQNLGFLKKVQLPEPAAPSGIFAPVYKAAGSVKNFAWDSAKFFVDGVTTFGYGLALSAIYSEMQRKLGQIYHDESILWYAEQQTQINEILADLKQYSVDYDLHASLLSAEVFNQDAKIHMQAFVKDMLQTTKDFTSDEIFQDQQYFAYLLGEVKKKYVKQSGEFDKLQAHIIPVIAKRQRALASDQAVHLFMMDQSRRSDIAVMCEKLVPDMEKLAAFTMINYDKHKLKIDEIIQSCNSFLAQMEQLLNATPEKLQELSKANCGMFTCVYEYERVLRQQLGYLHRYCKTV